MRITAPAQGQKYISLPLLLKAGECHREKCFLPIKVKLHTVFGKNFSIGTIGFNVV